LIAGRIALIEEVAPHSVDNVDAEAFQEVYRELVSMFASATEIGQLPLESEQVD
jgi:hypothetical protein